MSRVPPEDLSRYDELKLEAGLSFAGQNRYAEAAGFVLVDDAGYGAATPAPASASPTTLARSPHAMKKPTLAKNQSTKTGTKGPVNVGGKNMSSGQGKLAPMSHKGGALQARNAKHRV